ncbi:hypothetical protein HOLleu_25803 [Holothuria leucospilota]|uniref:Uncharacterized protein n=1 Tax=Holothuria leucospilota TaxID=206669 RepID=A0A9Q1H4S6_HOLLE|nr:hypothetical protein HOLleu_25803 [Holothuria leucospilota]
MASATFVTEQHGLAATCSETGWRHAPHQVNSRDTQWCGSISKNLENKINAVYIVEDAGTKQSATGYPKVIVYTCFEVRFVSASEQNLIRIFSKTTGNKRLNNVLQLCPHDFYTSPAGNIAQAYTFLLAFSKFSIIGKSIRKGVTHISYIIVIDLNGGILKKKKVDTGRDRLVRFCQFLPQHKVASVCQPNEIGVYDVHDGSYIWKDISDVISNWPKDRSVTCVATDPVNNHILVGRDESRDVYVFDDRLNYLHILTLPEMIKWARDMTVSDGHLLVCDYGGEKCYVTTMDGLESRLVGEFMKPNPWRSFKPRSVCSDKNGFVYVLWQNNTQFDSECCLVQYNHDGSQVLTTRMLDGDAEACTVVETSQGEILVVATYNKQTVYLYNLITED